MEKKVARYGRRKTISREEISTSFLYVVIFFFYTHAHTHVSITSAAVSNYISMRVHDRVLSLFETGGTPIRSTAIRDDDDDDYDDVIQCNSFLPYDTPRNKL